jgi:hypothetical protein
MGRDSLQHANDVHVAFERHRMALPVARFAWCILPEDANRESRGSRMTVRDVLVGGVSLHIAGCSEE